MITGSPARSAVFIRPLASAGVAGMHTIRPGVWGHDGGYVPPWLGAACCRRGRKRLGRVDRVGEDVAIPGRRVGLGRAARELDRVLHLAVDRLVDRVELGGAGGAQLAELAPEGGDRAAFRPRVDLGLRAVAADDR